MSSKTTQISTPKIISQIKKFVKENRGDKNRALFILEKLENGKKITRSDQSYLDKIILAPIENPKIKKSKEVEEKLKSLKKIISLDLGEPERLQYILRSMQENKTLYRSDSKYLDSKIKELDNLLKRKKTERKEKRIIKSNTKSKFVTRTSNKSNSTKLGNEHEINSQLKSVQAQIKDQKERLSKIIASNQSKKTKINPIGENYSNEQKIENRGPLRGQIVDDLVANKSQLFQIKAQREILSQQILVHKDRAEDTLRKKQEQLNNLKTEYEMIQRKTESEKQQIKHQVEKRDLENIPKNTLGKSIKGKIEVSVVALGMTVGFSVVMMKLSDVWPCDLFEMLNITVTQFC